MKINQISKKKYQGDVEFWVLNVSAIKLVVPVLQHVLFIFGA